MFLKILSWNDWKIKSKLMLSFTLIVLLPMILTGYFASSLIRDKINEKHKKHLETTANYVLNTFVEYKTKAFNYARLLMADNLIKDTLYLAYYSGERQRLERRLTEIYKTLDINILLVADKEGKVLVRAHNLSKYGDNIAKRPLVKKALSGEIAADSEGGWEQDESYGIRAVAPLFWQEEIIGLVSTGIYLDHEFAKKIKNLSGAEVALILGDKIYSASSVALEGKIIDREVIDEIKKTNKSVYKKLEINGQAYGVSYAPLEHGSILMVGLSLKDIVAAQMENTRMLLILLMIACIACLFVSYIIAKGFTKPFDGLIAMLLDIASRKGDLTQTIALERGDEVGKLAEVFNTMIKGLSEMIKQIRETAKNVTTASQSLSLSAQQMSGSTIEISDVIQQTSKGIIEQAANIENTFQVIQDMVTSLKRVGSDAQATLSASEMVTRTAQEGGELSYKAVERMAKINEVIASSAEVVKRLAERSKHISEIVNVLTGIADQINLLALNAAIEADRAGESGKGFAVVAEEVRKLAEDSSSSAKDIGKLVFEIQQETIDAVESMEAGIQEVIEGTKVVNAVGAVLTRIVKIAHDASQMVNQIATSISRQLEGTQKVVKSVSELANIAENSVSATQQINSSTQEQTASMQEMSASAQELFRMAVDLKELVAQFKLKESED